MPWEWMTRVKLPTGRRRTFHVEVNGRAFLRGEASSVHQILSQISPSLPKGAQVSVRRLA